MDLWSALVLGVVQGVTEWLPVSSSAQNMLVMIGFLGLNPQAAFSFSVFLHIGTMLAALVRFRRELFSAAREFFSKGSSKLVLFITVATLFSAITGLPSYLFVKESFLEHAGLLVTGLIGLLLVLTGVVLHYSKRRPGVRGLGDARIADASAAGLLQGVAVLPGISRSGVTAATLLLRGFSQEDALKLTFIISIPAVLGLVAVETLEGGLAGVDLNAAFAGIVVSFIVGYLTIDFLIKIANRLRFDLFCIGFGLLAVASSAAAFLLR